MNNAVPVDYLTNGIRFMQDLSTKNKGKIPTEHRRRTIAQWVEEHGSVSTEALAGHFDVSSMTIWRDLGALEQEGKVQQVRGGALRVESELLTEPAYVNKQTLHSLEKEAIARYAAQQFVHDGDIIILEAGTTVAAMVKYLHQRNLTVITNGINTMIEALPALPGLTVIGCGGILRSPAHTFVGPQAVQFFQSMRANNLFLSASGLTFPEGITDPNLLEIQVKQAMATSAERIILLMDSSKFGQRSLATVLPLEQVALLVTDAGTPQAAIAQLQAAGVDVHVVENAEAKRDG